MESNSIDQSKETLTLSLKTIPNLDRPIYLTGNFNNWQVDDPKFELKKINADTYEYTFKNLSNLPDQIEYKYTLGDWHHEELDEHGRPRLNRKITKTARHIYDFVPNWRNQHQTFRQEFLPIIQPIEGSFNMPVKIQTRRITALLPWDYHMSTKRYPVLYLQDGQNLFDEYAPYGNWALDKRLARLAEKGLHEVIIIAIDHASDKRILEFTPSEKTALGEGLGREYSHFLAYELKPHIDRHLRTLPYREFTGIGGSSLGGLITLYAAITQPEVFSRLMVFSPSLWVQPSLIQQFLKMDPPYCGRIYMYGGGCEGSGVVEYQRQLHTGIQHSGNPFIKSKLSVNPHGHHSESEWGREFPKALKWLFF
ncbi:phosphonate ABC transporter ATP-binding protein [Thermaurantimonas aggregans]|uniref:Phosphonate ABC transporter ATP-binding protein n=2 Tax=Thermaurantimonas aggregans TaxID=2173829 RepID=A0A401XNM4_9FLAO|nr:phosphonate ABC transporter ATP-binding protein [Thermaurantimonas aggregans]